MLPKTHHIDAIGNAVLNLLVAHAGYGLTRVHQDYGVDGLVRDIIQIDNRFIDLGVLFDFQLKTSTKFDFSKKPQIDKRLRAIIDLEMRLAPFVVIYCALNKDIDKIFYRSENNYQLDVEFYAYIPDNIISNHCFPEKYKQNLFKLTPQSFQDVIESLKDKRGFIH